MPTTGRSATLEEALPLPAGDDLVEDALLGAPVVEVVLDDIVTEASARDRARVERGDRLAQRRREALRVRLVRVPLDRRRRLEPLLDPVEAGGDQRREREVRVHVAAGNARLDPPRLAVPDHAEPAGPVVGSPG